MKSTQRTLRAVAACTLPLILAAPSLVHAHGAPADPPSRQYLCFRDNPENPSTEACRQAVQAGGKQQFYDWNGVRQGGANGDHQAVIKDGALCSGGDTALSMDIAAPWPAATLTPNAKGEVQFRYQITAPHATKYYRYFITRDNYDPHNALRWSDLESKPFCEIGPRPAESGTLTHTCTLPRDKAGRYMVYSIWQRSDSAEAFYGCMDVNLPGDQIDSPWQDSGGDGIQAKVDLPAGSTVTLRVFDKQRGSDLESHTLKIASGMTAKHMWPYYLAREVNGKSQRVRVGVLNDNGSVVPRQSATENRVYGNAAQYGYAIDTQVNEGNKPDGGGDPSQPGPSASAGQARTVVATTNVGFAYALDGTQSKGEGLSYRWEAVSGPFSVRNATQAKAEAIVPKNTTGETTFRLTVTDKNGKTATATTQVSAVAAKASIHGPATASANGKATFKASANFQGTSAKPLTFKWTMRDSAGKQVANGTGAQWTTPTLGAGKYSVALAAHSEHGMRTANASHTLAVSGGDTQPPVPACAPAWQAKQYPGGSKVTHNGKVYRAKWFTEPHHQPGAAGWMGEPWQDEGACK